MRRFAIAAVLAICLMPVAAASGGELRRHLDGGQRGHAVHASGEGVLNCASLRRAVLEAEANTDATDQIVLGAGTYTLSGGELVLSSGVAIVGASARQTTIIGGGSRGCSTSRPRPPTCILARMTIDEGFVDSANGGNILNEGELVAVPASRSPAGSRRQRQRRRDRELRRGPAGHRRA